MSEKNTDEYKIEEVGGRKKYQIHGNTQKNHTKKKTIVVGKVYAEWCGHCQMLKPEWKKMKNHINTKKGNVNVMFVEIEEKEMNNKLKRLEKKHGVSVSANGYPTLFRINNGQVAYYNGNRTYEKMADWYLNGENKVQNNILEKMPGLMQDVQGGSTRRYYRKYDNNKSTKIYKNRTRRHYSPLKKSQGIFDFLFGK